MEKRRNIMNATIYTWYDFGNGAHVSVCTIKHNPEKVLDHSCECGLRLTVSVPEGWHIGQNEAGDALLIKDGDSEGKLLQYNRGLNRVEEGIGDPITGEPIKGVSIISAEEF